MDATKPFPFPSETFACVYAEHMVEHIEYASARTMLKEIHRVLKHGCRVRLATPNLNFLRGLLDQPEAPLNSRYIEWASQRFSRDAPRPNGVFVFNNFVRDWGHVFIYDEETLRDLLETCGFRRIVACRLNESDVPALSDLANEARMPADFLALETMTLEAIK